MPKLNLGRVVGRDGGFGNIETRYINDGGAPSVTIEAQGEDTAKDFIFTFKNLVRDAATSDELEQIAAGENVQSSNVITALSMSVLWVKMKAAFAAFKHTHPGTDIDGKSITAAQLADHSVGKDQLETAVWESISPLIFVDVASASFIRSDKSTALAIVGKNDCGMSLTVGDDKKFSIGVKVDGVWSYRSV